MTESQAELIAFSGAIQGRLVRRYKRFFADVEVNGSIVTAHCPNPGRIAGLTDPGREAIITPARQGATLPYRLEALREGDVWVGVNTQWPNRLLPLLIDAGHLPELGDYAARRPEVTYGVNSRIDWWLGEHPSLPDIWVEVKSVHFSRTPGRAEFPDGVTARGAKHMEELGRMTASGHRAMVVFCVQRDDVDSVSLAADIDPAFAKAYGGAQDQGVEALAISLRITPAGIAWAKRLRI